MDAYLQIKSAFFLGVAIAFGAGCAGIDRVGAKLDMASEHVTSQKPVYEGQLKLAKAVGAMTSLQFTDGKIFEVRTVPLGLVSGDIVRLYAVDDEYVAHLWHSAESIPPSPESNALAPLLQANNKAK